MHRVIGQGGGFFQSALLNSHHEHISSVTYGVYARPDHPGQPHTGWVILNGVQFNFIGNRLVWVGRPGKNQRF